MLATMLNISMSNMVKYNLLHAKKNLQESFYKSAWEIVCTGGCMCGVVWCTGVEC